MAIPTSRVRPPSGTTYCGPLGMATNVMYYLCIVLAEAMLIVRTYAFWKRDRKILIVMCAFGLVCMLAAIVVSETIASQPTNSVYKSLDCLGVESSVATAIQYVFLILYEMGILGLNWIAFQRMKRHNPPGPLITTLYRDGVMYVAAILVFSVINAVVTLASPIQYADILNSPQMVMHSILASRIFFNLRETTRGEQRNTIATPLTDFRAAPQGSSGFSSSLGSSSSSSGIDPTKTIDTTRVMGISRERAVQG
ncbi:hypothetical protein OG21DRAFT_1512951 [Imleria badia]|nr:hypothetical protein OG21DRAFT_1512951 [Imleria badia]